MHNKLLNISRNNANLFNHAKQAMTQHKPTTRDTNNTQIINIPQTPDHAVPRLPHRQDNGARNPITLAQTNNTAKIKTTVTTISKINQIIATLETNQILTETTTTQTTYPNKTITTNPLTNKIAETTTNLKHT
jgi:hypothetical protein